MMIKKVVLIVSFISILVSCKPKDANNEQQAEQVKDSTIVGADKDENGCLASAGYTWSKLNKECVRVFTGIQLLPVEKSENPDDAVFAAYLMFDDSGDKVEVFLPDEESIILTRSAEGKPWTAGDYQLIPWKGYVLKKAGKSLFAGDGQVGNKVTGSDEPEGE